MFRRVVFFYFTRSFPHTYKKNGFFFRHNVILCVYIQREVWGKVWVKWYFLAFFLKSLKIVQNYINKGVAKKTSGEWQKNQQKETLST